MLLPHPFKKGLVVGLTGLVLLSLVVFISLASLSPNRAAPHTKTLGISSTGSPARVGLPATTTGTWSATGAMSIGRYGHTATLLPNGTVLVVGGREFPTDVFATAELYNPVSGTWSPTGSTMSTARGGHTATLLPNGTVLVAGGGRNSDGPDGYNASATAELYNPVSGTWSPTGSMSTARYGHTATLLPNGKVLVAGGFDYDAWLYNPVSGTWSRIDTMSAHRTDYTATLLPNGKVLVVGGLVSEGLNYNIVATAELYNPVSRTWSPTGSMSTARANHTATLLPNGTVVVTGGRNGSNYYNASATAELYNPVTGTWSPTGSMSTARYGHTATFLPNGTVLVAGGWSSSAELYTAVKVPPTASFYPTMASRFGEWPNHVLRYPSTLNTSNVLFNACWSTHHGSVLYTWTYSGHSFSTPRCDNFTLQLPPGRPQQITLTVTDATGQTSSPLTQIFTPRDLFIVSLGDSVASGEGNPDIAGQCDQPSSWDWITNSNPTTHCNAPPLWQPQFPDPTGHENAQCHRSTVAGPVQAALQLEQQSSQTSVTFLHLACSGATVMQGLLDPQKVDTHGGAWSPLVPQLQELNSLRHGRPIDALLITIGANDINFRGIIETCIKLGLLARHLDCGTQSVEQALENKFQQDLGRLGTNLDALNACISKVHGRTCSKKDLYLGMPANHVFITGYFDSARGDDGSYCNDIPLSVNTWSWAEHNIVAPLNALLGKKAKQFGWHAIGDFNGPPYSDSFLTHGYCAKQTWIRPFNNDTGNTPAGDAQRGTFSMQGDVFGAMHPNSWGHQRYAASYVKALTAAFPFLKATSPSVSAERTVSLAVTKSTPMTSLHAIPGTNPIPGREAFLNGARRSRRAYIGRQLQ